MAAASRTRWPNETAALRCAVEALNKVLPWLEREVGPQYSGVNSEGLPIERQPESGEEACGFSAMALRAMLAKIAAILERGKS
jgi:hypothetical protein